MVTRPSSDTHFLIAGAAAAAVLPASVFGLGLPFWAGLLIAGGTFAGVAVLTAQKSALEGFDLSRVERGQRATLKAVLDDAAPALETLNSLAPKIDDVSTRGHALNIARTAKGLIKGLEREPASLATVQRALTYYLPHTTEFVTAYVALENRGLKRAPRTRELDQIIAKLDHGFSHFLDQLADDELGLLDTDIRLVGEALKDDVAEAKLALAPHSGGTT